MTVVVWYSRHSPEACQLRRVFDVFKPTAYIHLKPERDYIDVERVYQYLRERYPNERIVVIPLIPLGAVKRLLEILEEKQDSKFEIWWLEMRDIARGRPDELLPLASEAMRRGKCIVTHCYTPRKCRLMEFTGIKKLKRLELVFE